MNKVLPRLFTFIVGVPLFIGLVSCDVFHHLPLHIILLLTSTLAANEMHNIFSVNFKLQPKFLVISMCVLTTIVASVCAIFELPLINRAFESMMNYTFMGAIMFCLAWEVFSSKTFENSNSHLITSAFTILYCGFFNAFIARMTLVPHSKVILAVFLAMVFFCDSAAWLFGNLFGKNNKGFIKASPNKSIAGFCGGFIGTIAIGLLAHYLCLNNQTEMNAFGASTTFGIIKVIMVSVFTASAAIIGDLVESVFKRSSGVKDSGHLVPGRGGMLDCLDSILFAAPVYYLSYTLLLAR